MKHFTADSPEVKQALAGVFRGGKIFLFRVGEDGLHRKVNATEILRSLGIPFENIGVIPSSYPFPCMAFDSANKREKLAREARVQARQQEPDKQKAKLASKKYCLVRQGDYFGAYNLEDGTQTLFHSEEEALQEINYLMHGYDEFRFFPKQRRPELQEI